MCAWSFCISLQTFACCTAAEKQWRWISFLSPTVLGKQRWDWEAPTLEQKKHITPLCQGPQMKGSAILLADYQNRDAAVSTASPPASSSSAGRQCCWLSWQVAVFLLFDVLCLYFGKTFRALAQRKRSLLLLISDLKPSCITWGNGVLGQDSVCP